MNPDEAIRKLKEGNSRFVSGKSNHHDLVAQRKALVGGQKPFAIILTCSDSRVAPEHIFDSGLGELFVIRNAGNLAEPIAIGSMEYAAEHLGSTLLVVMGHESCGAVKAACMSEHAEGNIGAIVADLQEAVKMGNKEPERVAPENVKIVIGKIRSGSSILQHLEKDGKLKIIGATYSLSTGEVSYL
jgi:carbonic anhydrase